MPSPSTRRVVVTGARGFVAGSLLWQTPRDCGVHAMSRGACPRNVPGVTWHTLREDSIEAALALCDALAPHAIIHTAAIADIDRCEADHALADEVNARFPALLAEWAGRNGARLVYLSTDNVFSGAEGGYRETDSPNPVNYYGHTKAAAERAVLMNAPHAVVARVALVMGLPILGEGNSFLARMIPQLREGRELGVPPDEIRSPIDVITLGKALWELSGNAFSGIVHLAGNDRLSRLDMVRRIARHLGFDPSLVVANDPTGIPGRAARPVDVSLDNTLARQTLATTFCGIEEGVERVLQAAAEKENAARS